MECIWLKINTNLNEQKTYQKDGAENTGFFCQNKRLLPKKPIM